MGALTVWRKQAGNFSTEVVNLLANLRHPIRSWRSRTPGCSARSRTRASRSKPPTGTSRNSSPTCRTSCARRSTPSSASLKSCRRRLFGELNEKQAEYTDDILTSGRHLFSLINEILDLSKVEAGRMELELATFDLPLAIDNARTFVRERATRHGITLDVTDRRASWRLRRRRAEDQTDSAQSAIQRGEVHSGGRTDRN